MHATRVRFGTGSSGFGCRGVSGAVARAHGPCFDMEMEKWLGEEFEDGVIVVKLPTSYALALQMAVASAAIKPEDVPGAVTLDDAQLLYVASLHFCSRSSTTFSWERRQRTRA